MLLEVSEDDDNGSTRPRLDQYLSLKLTDFSRARLQKLIEDGAVKVNEKPAKAGQKLRPGDLISLDLPDPVPLDAVAEEIPLAIVFEDENLLVINKPAGMVTHPGAGVNSGTLVNAVLHHARGSLSSIGGVVRPGIVHRLDKDTSGLIMVAKNDRAHQSLAAQLKVKSARRSYLALVEGSPGEESGTIDLPIGRHPKKRVQMTVVTPAMAVEARHAVTHYQVLEHFHKYALLACQLETGRTHQIRVHLSHLGLPIVGDLVYNQKTTGTLPARAKLGLKGQALHAHKLSFTHPVSGKLLEFEADLPADLKALIDRLRNSANQTSGTK
ncbi:MAG TPA: RluA family pseudouridine synthase [Candidatus Obscuribacter sp.]|nr:RluA family pseudouridine synthase [Candidatus Obscuribacter sp.]MBK9276885.1 RluA family pseudouridine synthase [Candidatus Obscuribacter sp.]HMY52845.1 RluA family pseudouridine synthase [Candidatus Obscuribacter sp.]HNG19736.1 RluA family pseudouridine synthase [Candidatus Obscuribacter sp.]